MTKVSLYLSWVWMRFLPGHSNHSPAPSHCEIIFFSLLLSAILSPFSLTSSVPFPPLCFPPAGACSLLAPSLSVQRLSLLHSAYRRLVFKCTNEATDQRNRRQGTHSARVAKRRERRRMKGEGSRQHLLLSSYAPVWPFFQHLTVEINLRANRTVDVISVHARVAATRAHITEFDPDISCQFTYARAAFRFDSIEISDIHATRTIVNFTHIQVKINW